MIYFFLAQSSAVGAERKRIFLLRCWMREKRKRFLQQLNRAKKSVYSLLLTMGMMATERSTRQAKLRARPRVAMTT
jgi:hypothetical protein